MDVLPAASRLLVTLPNTATRLWLRFDVADVVDKAAIDSQVSVLSSASAIRLPIAMLKSLPG